MVKRIEVYRSDNGQLEDDLKRAKAHDIQHALEEALRARTPYGEARSRIGFSEALELLDNATLLCQHLTEYVELAREGK